MTEPFCCIFVRASSPFLGCAAVLPKKAAHNAGILARQPHSHPGLPSTSSQCAARLPLPGSAFGCGPGGVSHWAPCLLASIVASQECPSAQLAFQTISPPSPAHGSFPTPRNTSTRPRPSPNLSIDFAIIALRNTPKPRKKSVARPTGSPFTTSRILLIRLSHTPFNSNVARCCRGFK